MTDNVNYVVCYMANINMLYSVESINPMRSHLFIISKDNTKYKVFKRQLSYDKQEYSSLVDETMYFGKYWSYFINWFFENNIKYLVFQQNPSFNIQFKWTKIAHSLCYQGWNNDSETTIFNNNISDCEYMLDQYWVTLKNYLMTDFIYSKIRKYEQKLLPYFSTDSSDDSDQEVFVDIAKIKNLVYGYIRLYYISPQHALFNRITTTTLYFVEPCAIKYISLDLIQSDDETLSSDDATSSSSSQPSMEGEYTRKEVRNIWNIRPKAGLNSSVRAMTMVHILYISFCILIFLINIKIHRNHTDILYFPIHHKMNHNIQWILQDFLDKN